MMTDADRQEIVIQIFLQKGRMVSAFFKNLSVNNIGQYI
jgi:hypothetical protein